MSLDVSINIYRCDGMEKICWRSRCNVERFFLKQSQLAPDMETDTSRLIDSSSDTLSVSPHPLISASNVASVAGMTRAD